MWSTVYHDVLYLRQAIPRDFFSIRHRAPAVIDKWTITLAPCLTILLMHGKPSQLNIICVGGIWYFIRFPISYCLSSSYSSWGPHKTYDIIQNNIIQNIIRQEQLKDRTTYIFKKAHVAYISMHPHKLSRSNRGESLCREVLLYLFY